MGTNKSNQRPSVAERQRARKVMKALLQDTKIKRQTQAETFEALKQHYQGNIPPALIWDQMADRRIAASTMTRGAELARS